MTRENKKTLRTDMRRVLSNLDERWAKAASREVCKHLSELVERIDPAVAHILAWAPHFEGEIDLSPFIEQQLGRRMVYLPRCQADRSMTFVSIGLNWAQSMTPGYGGILEPHLDSGTVYDPHAAAHTMVLTPGLVFDTTGGRLGRGQGFYDRFLNSALMRRASVVGVCWSLQIQPEVPMTSDDCGVNYLVTEETTIEC